MRVESVVDLLREASLGSRPLDAMVAQAIGWRKIDRLIRDERTGEVRDKTLWLIPNSNDPGRLPLYTSNIEAAYLLVQQVRSSAVSGFSWQDKSATAQVGEGGPRVTAATPALAICLAALMTVASEAVRNEH
ncbi:MAG: hypothetical protein EOP06_00945 [Proteobacteria bacterium]|nr:MAG: hypothetical protein EOP06_00945 [Pseudomonadota bacterium]